ncbi:MAG: hypothetical protein ABSA48_16370 [Terracidiphilus sp.]
MITRSLVRRLERLETRLIPAGEPVVINVHFVATDGSRVGGVRFTVPRAGGRPTGSAGVAGGARPVADRQYREGPHR